MSDFISQYIFRRLWVKVGASTPQIKQPPYTTAKDDLHNKIPAEDDLHNKIPADDDLHNKIPADCRLHLMTITSTVTRLRVGYKLQKKLDGVCFEQVKMKRSDQILQNSIQVENERVHINPLLLFGRLTSLAQRHEDIYYLYYYEMGGEVRAHQGKREL